MKEVSKALLIPAKERLKPFSWSIRNWVQTAVLALTVLIGLQFYIYVLQLEQGGAMSITRPPGVEGFLPIGSLMGWKYFFLTSQWDPVHPAGMVILGFAILISLVLRKSFCGWFCPVGTISEWLWRLGRNKAGRNFLPPSWIDIPLRSLKYILLALFAWAVFSMDSGSLERFFALPYWKVSDIKMLYFFERMSLLTVAVLFALLIGSIFIRNFWCRYLCPYGALVGIFGFLGPTRIKRNEETCIDCNLCAKVCPAYLPVDVKPRIISAECTGCISCVEVCPVKNTLELKTIGIPASFWNGKRMAGAVIGLFLILIISARFSGHWTSSITIQEIRSILPSIDFLNHISR
ncbi:MAG: 4Fe-4S binding protein [Candidatus Marinimicrobia bacterium]|nr:4Fe-4S binding protein [Candidatus Neomarinimicrobiota bacterium]